VLDERRRRMMTELLSMATIAGHFFTSARCVHTFTASQFIVHPSNPCSRPKVGQSSLHVSGQARGRNERAIHDYLRGLGAVAFPLAASGGKTMSASPKGWFCTITKGVRTWPVGPK
jgi:hypothetical protein